METAEPNVPSPSPDELARIRAQTCAAELQAVLAKHRCRIVPQLRADPVGTEGARAILAASYAIVPEMP